MTYSDAPLAVDAGRFSRLEAIEWWDQSRLRRASVLVVGAGALGNEVIKNLALLGVGHLVIVDLDRVERSNLSRSVLFRESDTGTPKAQCAARAAMDLCPEVRAEAVVGSVQAEVGLGRFRAAQVIVGAVDNREARVFINAACARVGRPWIDGGIDVLHGIVRGFAPPATACYECTMSQVDWDLLNQQRSCSLLERRARAQGGTPTTPTTAAVIGALQVQEVVKLLHDLPVLLGRGMVFDGAGFSSYTVQYPIHPHCGWHEAAPPIEPVTDLGSDAPVRRFWERAERILGPLDAIDLCREVVDELNCSACGTATRVLVAAGRLRSEDLLCRRCGSERAARFLHSITGSGEIMERTLSQIGLPRRDILWARSGDRCVGLEVAADRCGDAGVSMEPEKRDGDGPA